MYGQNFANANDLKHLPGDAEGPPLFGRTFDYFHDPLALARSRYQRYGELSWMRGFGMHILSLLGPDANALIYRNPDGAFSNQIGWEFYLSRFFHRGLMLLDGEEHRFHRRIMQAAFKRDALAADLEQMNPVIARTIAGWPTGTVHLFDLLKAITLDVGTEVFVGEAIGNESAAMNHAFLATVRAGTDPLRMPIPGTRWWAGIRGRKRLEAFFQKRLAAKHASSGANLFARLCHARSEDGDAYADDDVVNQMIFLLMAAHDTSTISMTNMMYQLGRHPEWQQRLREESRSLGKDVISQDDLPKLEQMTLVFHEALRLVAPLPFKPRATTRDIEFKGHRIPANTMVQAAPHFSHHMPEYWSHPECFDPERFSPERAEDKQHPFLFVPFGGGAHKCIGMHFGEMEVKATMHQILLNFEWSVPTDYRMEQDWTSLPIPRDRLPLHLTRI